MPFTQTSRQLFLIALAAALPASAQTTITSTAPTPATQPAPALTVTAPKKPDEFLTQAQLVQAYREKQYLLVISETGRILNNPRLAVTRNRFSLLVLRAESFIQSKNFAPALNAFKAAAAEAPNADKKAVMLATALLIQRRTGLSYVPKMTDAYGNLSADAGAAPGRPAATIDLLDLSQRENALRALFWDNYYKTRLDIFHTRTLPQLKAAIDALYQVETLETAAGAQQSETKKLRQAAAVAGESVVTSLVIVAKQDIEREFKEAQRIETVMSDPPPASTRDPRPAAQAVQRYKGLDQNAMARLDSTLEVLGKVPATVDEIVDQTKSDPQLFAPVVKRAAALKKETRELIDQYSKAGLLR